MHMYICLFEDHLWPPVYNNHFFLHRSTQACHRKHAKVHVFNVSGQTGKDCLLTWVNGVKSRWTLGIGPQPLPWVLHYSEASSSFKSITIFDSDLPFLLWQCRNPLLRQHAASQLLGGQDAHHSRDERGKGEWERGKQRERGGGERERDRARERARGREGERNRASERHRVRGGGGRE